MKNDSFHLSLIIFRPMTAEAQNKTSRALIRPRSPRPPSRARQPSASPSHTAPSPIHSPRPCVAPRMLPSSSALLFAGRGPGSYWSAIVGLGPPNRPLAASDGGPACRRIARRVCPPGSLARTACLCAISRLGRVGARRLDWLARPSRSFLARPGSPSSASLSPQRGTHRPKAQSRRKAINSLSACHVPLARPDATAARRPETEGPRRGGLPRLDAFDKASSATRLSCFWHIQLSRAPSPPAAGLPLITGRGAQKGGRFSRTAAEGTGVWRRRVDGACDSAAQL